MSQCRVEVLKVQVYTYKCTCTCVYVLYMYMGISMNHNSLGCEQPSRPRSRTIIQCAGRVSANVRPLQLCWGDRECRRFMPCTYNTDGCFRFVLEYACTCAKSEGSNTAEISYIHLPLNQHEIMAEIKKSGVKLGMKSLSKHMKSLEIIEIRCEMKKTGELLQTVKR